MINVNGVEFNFDDGLLELNYNITEPADKQYTWCELQTIIGRIPQNFTILYDTGCIWDMKNEKKYIFDTFSETPIFKYDFEKNKEGEENIFSVLDAYDFGPISGLEYVNQLNKYLSNIGHKNLVVEYFHLVLIKF